MYDVKFGDCFQLTENLFADGLVVDFGSMLNLGSRFDDIIAHFKSTTPQKLLLTHYHLDHLSGLLYMMRQSNIYQFKEILIPDVFSTRGLHRAIVLLYLESFLDSCVLPRKGSGRQYTLLEFVKSLCVHPINVTLLKRGNQFQRIKGVDTCTVLWPDENYIVNYADSLLNQFDINSNVIQGLTNISEITADLILSLTESRENTIDGQYREALLTIQTQLDDIFSKYDLKTQLLKHQTALNSFEHSVNVVFHNSTSGENNFLFTGDVETSVMNVIAANPSKL